MDMDRILHKLDPALMERETLTSAEFPIFFVEDHLDESNRGGVEWRWHPDLEFNVVLKGTMEVYLDDVCLELSAGQGILKNSSLLHRSVIAPDCRQAEMFNITMGAEFIAPAQSLLYQKYMAPIQGNRRLRFLPLYPEIPWQGEILDLLLQVQQVNLRQEGAYELHIHQLMCTVWRILAEHVDELPQENLSPQSFTDQIRIKQMLDCIHSRYQEKLTLGDIAAAAHVSENTCRTCFRAMVHRSPTEYLTEFRLQQAIRLLRSTDLTAQEIALQCGFGDSSYFNRLFRQRMGMTPLQYRQDT